MNEMNRWKDTPLYIIYLLGIILPFLYAVIGEVSFDRQIDAAFLNGLLTASSIFFGFSSLLVVTEKPVERRLYSFMIIALFSLVLSGAVLTSVALGKINGVLGLLILSASFNVNAMSTVYIAGYKGATWKKKTLGKERN